MFARTATRSSRVGLLTKRTYAAKRKLLLDKIGDENTKESQRTLKVVRYIGAGSVITVLCSLLWASSLSAPVKETIVEIPDLKKDVRE